jgi:hypothetical protein
MARRQCSHPDQWREHRRGRLVPPRAGILPVARQYGLHATTHRACRAVSGGRRLALYRRHVANRELGMPAGSTPARGSTLRSGQHACLTSGHGRTISRYLLIVNSALPKREEPAVGGPWATLCRPWCGGDPAAGTAPGRLGVLPQVRFISLLTRPEAWPRPWCLPWLTLPLATAALIFAVAAPPGSC